MHPGQSKAVRAMDAFVQYAAVLLAFLLPLFVVPIPWIAVAQSKALLGAVFVVIALIVWLISNVAGRRILFSLDALLLAAILIPVAYAISALASGSPFSSIVSGDAVTGTVASMFLLLGASLVGAAAAEHRVAGLYVLVAMIISGGLVAVFQLVRIWMPGILSLNGLMAGNTSSVVGAWHDLGIFAAVLLLMCYGLLETSLAENRILKILMHAVGLLSAAVLIVVNFPDIWYALSGAAVVFALIKVLRTYRRHSSLVGAARSAVLWIAFALFAAACGYFTHEIFSHLPAQMQISQTEVRPSLQGTFVAGQELYQGGKGLVFGSGPNTFTKQWLLFKPAEVNATTFWNTEFQYGYGVIPTVLVTLGVVGTLVWTVLTLALLWAGYRAVRSDAEGKFNTVLFVICGFLLLYHIIYVPSIGISLLLFLLIGVLAGFNARSWYSGALTLEWQSMAVFIVVIVVCCSAIAGSLLEVRSIASNLYVSKAVSSYQATGNLQEAASLVQQAVKIDSQNDLAQRSAVQIGILQFSELTKNSSTDQATVTALQKTLSDTIAHGLAAVSIDDSSYQNWLALAGLYQSLAGVGIQGAYEQAITAWSRAASTTPSNPLPLVQLGQLSMAQNRNPEAKAYFSQAIALKPDLALPYYLRSQIEVGEQRYEEAVKDGVAAAQIANQDPLAWYSLGVILYIANDNADAQIALEKAVSLQNGYSDALFALTVVYDKLGKHPEALAAALRVAQLNPNQQIAQTLLQNIQSNKPALNGIQNTPSSAGTKKP